MLRRSKLGGGMFGNDDQDDNQNQPQNDQPQEDATIVPPMPDSDLSTSPTVTNDASQSPAAQPQENSGDETGAPVVTDSAGDYEETPQKTDDAQPSQSAAVSSDDGDLIGIKKEALQQLSPLVGHLEQSPEEKFKTTMMMIQAADDKTLVKTAYEAAKDISDEKARAQALLDVINEINYFTHTPDDQKD